MQRATSIAGALMLAVACGGESEQAAVDAAGDLGDAAALDVARPHDATVDARFDAGTCGPPDVSTFVPPAYVPASGARQGLCTQGQIDDFYASCLAPTATAASCAPFGANGTPENKACAACIATKDTAAKYGPLVVRHGVVSINIAGCMELLDVAAGTQCGHSYEVSEACGEFMCSNDSCVVVGCQDITPQCYFACLHDAAMYACRPYAQAATCADSEADGGVASGCFRGTTFQDYYANVVPLFCGSAVADASAE